MSVRRNRKPHGQLGVAPSSKRFKTDIRPIGNSSETVLALKPVSFRYNADVDCNETPQFGLVAEDVDKVNPDLVVRDKEGKPFSVRYDAVNAMLLNEFLKAHRKIEEQEAALEGLRANGANQEATIRELRRDIGVLAAQLKEQSLQMQKVSAQMEANKPASRIVTNR
jgi:hypothetical protein